MAHLPVVNEAQVSEGTQKVFKALQARLEAVPNIWRIMANAADVLHATLAMEKAIQRELPPKLRELAYLESSQLNGCHY